MQKSKLKDPAAVIDYHINDIGLRKRVVARRAGIQYEMLCRSLQGRRALKADEVLSLMIALGLTLDDFKKE